MSLPLPVSTVMVEVASPVPLSVPVTMTSVVARAGIDEDILDLDGRDFVIRCRRQHRRAGAVAALDIDADVVDVP